MTASQRPDAAGDGRPRSVPQPPGARPAPGLRPASARDGTALVALDALCWSPQAMPGPPPRERETGFSHAPGNVLVAELPGPAGQPQLVGYVALSPPTRLPSNSHVLQVQGLAVHPDHRRAGLGRLLLSAAVNEARRRGARKLSLRVLATNPGARRLYEQAGFTVEGVQRGEFHLEGADVDDVLMARSLEGPAP